MMLRTHLAIGVFAVLLFLPHVTEKAIFIVVAVIASILPDIDSGFSTFGRLGISRFAQFLTKHRGFLHSFSFCFVIVAILAFFLPVLSLPFFVGYSIHLFADSFTIEGIKPFWPLRTASSWKLRTGSYSETVLFIIFLLTNVFILIFFA